MGNIFTPKVGGKRELSLANDLLHQKKYEEALEYAKQALEIIRQRNDMKDISTVNGKIMEIQALIEERDGNLKNATSAFGQSGRFYQQGQLQIDVKRVIDKQVNLLIERGRNFSKIKKFNEGAALFEEASISLKSIGSDVESLEIRAKAYVFRAAAVQNIADRKGFLMKVVEYIQDSGITQPLVLGHLEYYKAQAEKM